MVDWNIIHIFANVKFKFNNKKKGDMETKEIIIPQGWEIDKVKGNYIIYGNKRNHYPTRLGQGWKPDWTSANEYIFPNFIK